jgi:hypothetical protein
MQPVNPTANAAANAPTNPTANTAANAPANAAPNIAGNAANNAANAANTQANAVANPRQNVGVQPPPVQDNNPEGSQHRRIRDEVEIARCANYDHNHGVLTLWIPTTPSKQQSCGICTTNNSYDVPNMTKTTALSMTSTSS